MNLLARLKPLISQPREIVLQGYSHDAFWRRSIVLFGAIYAVTLIAAGASFAIYGPNVLMPAAAILAVLSLLVVWVLPETGRAPVVAMRRFFLCFLISLLFWPDYLAFDFPGLPWITALRLFAVPLGATFLICLSVSADFRATLKKITQESRITNYALIAFTVLAGLSVVYSRNPGDSANSFAIAVTYWILIFYVSVYVLRNIHYVYLLTLIIWLFALVACGVAFWEWRNQGVPWAGHIPSFLAVGDPVVAKILSGSARSTTNVYRLQGKFTTPLGLAEFLAFSTPFVLYHLVYSTNLFVKILALSTLPVVFFIILLTDSRLGAAGFFIAFLLALASWAVTRWYKNKESLFGPLLTLSFPLVLLAFMIATLVVGRLRNIIWGTGAQSFSTQAREAQWDSGIPKLLVQPWGYGLGQGGSVLGYRNLAGGLTIDSHYLAVLLEIGILGFAVYSVIFLSSLAYGTISLLNARTKEHMLIVPFMSLIAIFVVEKAVFAQLENHPLVFISLGAVTAICWQIRSDNKVVV